MAKQPKKDSPAHHPSKIYDVKIASIRVPPAGVTQRKFNKAHAEEIAANLDFDKIGVPVINHRDGNFWVVDGQHRVAAIKMWFAPSDPGVLRCQVYENLTDKEMADLFVSINRRRRVVQPFTNFQICCTAEYKRESDILRTVEAQNLKVSQSKEPNCVGAVGALGAVYDRAGVVVLGQVLRVLRDAYGGDPAAFDGQLIQGIGLVFNRYNGRTDERALASRLSSSMNGARGLLRRAEAQRERTGNQKAQCVAATVVDVYNKGAKPSQRLAPWWKSLE